MKCRGCASLVLVCAASLATVSGAGASDGEREINAAVAQAGALNGSLLDDPPGYPVVISEPGSYRLAGNLEVVGANDTAVQILADGVSLDLGGFRIAGPIVCTSGPPFGCSGSGSGHGVVGSSARGTSVTNGTLRGLGGNGLLLGPHAAVSDVVALSNGATGIQIGLGGAVRDSLVRVNGGLGVEAGSDAVLEGIIASHNGGTGIRAGAQSTLGWHFAELNGGSGVQAGTGSSFLANLTGYNERSGILLDGVGEISDSLAHGHPRCGISLGPGGLANTNVAAVNNRQVFARAGPERSGASGNVLASDPELTFAQGSPPVADLGGNLCAGACDGGPVGGGFSCE